MTDWHAVADAVRQGDADATIRRDAIRCAVADDAIRYAVETRRASMEEFFGGDVRTPELIEAHLTTLLSLVEGVHGA